MLAAVIHQRAESHIFQHLLASNNVMKHNNVLVVVEVESGSASKMRISSTTYPDLCQQFFSHPVLNLKIL
jgi:hypothetical protein